MHLARRLVYDGAWLQPGDPGGAGPRTGAAGEVIKRDCTIYAEELVSLLLGDAIAASGAVPAGVLT